MKIKNIQVWREALGTIKPYTIAFKTIDEVSNAFVELTLANGITGLGAGNPSEDVVGENLDQTMQALDVNNLDFLIGRDVREINQLTYEIRKRFPQNPAARAALDIALHDAFTKLLDVPLVKYLGQKIHSMPTSNTIGIKNVADTLTEAREYVARGFNTLKVKLGMNLEEDIERLVKLREEFHNSIVIRVDANQGYSVDATLEFCRRTRELNIELIEQPLPARAVDTMKALPDDIRSVIAADESLITPDDAFDLILPPRSAGIFNIKLMKCGGVREALKIATIAEQAGVSLFWGCNDESIVSITAALHTAFSCAHTRYIDLDGSLDLARDVVKGGFILEKGIMRCSDKPGLGLERI